MCINARSFISKRDLLEIYIRTFGLDIIFVTKTWFNQNITDGEVAIKDFQCYRQDRQNRIGGGVGIYIRRSIHAMRIDGMERFK